MLCLRVLAALVAASVSVLVTWYVRLLELVRRTGAKGLHRMKRSRRMGEHDTYDIRKITQDTSGVRCSIRELSIIIFIKCFCHLLDRYLNRMVGAERVRSFGP
jgi:hypothetical protein